jgi:cysteinyl-tRNA synthetase
MCVAHLGVTFDLHGGGKDLIFPHHENEIAQSQGAYGEGTFARHWLHNGFLNFEGEKMARSVGNVYDLRRLVAEVGAEALRFFVVSHHYRSPVEFEVGVDDGVDGPIQRFKSIEAADRRLEYFYLTLQRIDSFLAQGGDAGDGAVVPGADGLLAEVRAALADDFNSPVAVAAAGEAAKLANKLLDEGKGIDKQVRRRSLARIGRDLRTVGEALGIFASAPGDYLVGRRQRLVQRRRLDVAAVEQLLADRTAARKAKDFAAADVIRGRLTELGVEVLDTPSGTDWRITDSA